MYQWPDLDCGVIGPTRSRWIHLSGRLDWVKTAGKEEQVILLRAQALHWNWVKTSKANRSFTIGRRVETKAWPYVLWMSIRDWGDEDESCIGWVMWLITLVEPMAWGFLTTKRLSWISPLSTVNPFLVRENLSWFWVRQQSFLARRPGLMRLTTISGTKTQSSKVMIESLHSILTVPIPMIFKLASSFPVLITSCSSWVLRLVKYLRLLNTWILAPKSRIKLGVLSALIHKVRRAW